eukprot:Nitzschia sp. Nitz4//scaffold7_size249615//15816//16733//NITZ4_001137-RA/size249615-processed-gene-0.276-mRNA-1//1//CDS//3329558322//9392//frame0
MDQVSVILLCGLPASGKSTWARRITKALEDQSQPNEYRVIHLEYDVLEDALIQDPSSPEVRREAWNEARTEATRQLKEHIHSRSPIEKLIILMDDNYYFRGMRKDIHRLLLSEFDIHSTEETNLRFGLVWVKTPVSICLERNPQRSRPVDDSIITQMQEKFEPPRLFWEVDCCLTLQDTSTLDSVLEFVRNCPKIIPLPEENEEEQEAERKRTRENFLCQMDQRLRQWVGHLARHDKSLARGANQARKEILHGLKDPDNKEYNMRTTSTTISPSDFLMDFLGRVENISGQCLDKMSLQTAMKCSP